MTFINLTTREIVEADEAPEGFVLWTQEVQDAIDAEAQAAREAVERAEQERLAKLAAEEALQQAIRDAEALANANAVIWLAADKWIRNGAIVATLPAVPTPVATNIGMVFGTPSPAVRVWWYQSQGYSVATPEDIAAAEAKAIADAQAAEAARIAAEEARVIAEQQAYILDLETNAKFYALQNAYLLLCESVTGKREKLAGEVQAAIVKQLETVDPVQGRAIHDAFSFLADAMNYYTNKWWDVVQYRNIPELVKAAQGLLALKG